MSATVITHETALAVDLHGLTLVVDCPLPDVREAVARRLAHLPRSSRGEADLLITYAVGEPPDLPGGARVVYESEFGTVSYTAGTDELSARYGEVTMRCSPAEGVAEVFAPGGLRDATWLLSRPMLTLPLMEMARRHGLYPLHAACLAWQGRGIVVAGPSGSGKTTTAIALVRAGLDFLADDLVFHTAGPTVRLLAFPDELGLPDREPEQRGWPKARADVREVAPARVVRDCTPELLVLLSDEREGTAMLEPVSHGDALLDLLPTMLLTDPATCSAHLGSLDDLVSATRPVRARGGAPVDIAARILEVLNQRKDAQ